MTTEKLESEIRKKQIIQATLEIISSSGISNLNIASISSRIGLVPSAIYRHFKGKEEVIDAVLEHIHNSLIKNVNSVCAQSSDSIKRLSALLELHISLIINNQAIPRLIFSEEVISGKPGRKSRLYGIVNSYLEKISEIIVRGQNENRIRSDIDPETISVMFLGLIQPNAILWHISGGEFDVNTQARKSWEIFSDFISVK